MIKFTKDSYVDLDLYEERLRELGHIYIDKIKMNLLYKYESTRRDTEYYLAFSVMNANSGNRFLDMSASNVYEYLVEYGKCPEHKFKSKGVSGVSLDMKKVLAPLYEMGYAKEFLAHYMRYKSLKSKCSKIATLLEALWVKDSEDTFGNSIYKLPYNVSQQKNLRYNYSNYDVIGIPKEYNSSICCPKGYVVASGDFAQSDLRIAYNLYIRDEKNIKIMDTCEDKYEGMARIVSEFYGEKFDHDKFILERSLYKVYCLATIYGQRAGDTPEGDKFIKRFTKYLETCPRYMEYYKRITQRCDLGLPVQITGYFGHTQIIDLDRYRIKTTINDALNSPNQMGTSQIIILTVNTILDKFYALGYKPSDISVYYVRHDEPLFIMKEEVLKDAWIFKECEDIIVDNWTPLKLTFDFAYNYTEVDEYLMEKAHQSYEDNKHRITIEKPSVDVKFDYYPIPKTLVLSVIYTENRYNPLESICCVYSSELNAADYFTIKSNNKDEIVSTIMNKLVSKEETFYEMGYRGAVIWNNFITQETYNGKMFFNFNQRVNLDTSKAQVLLEEVHYRLASNYNTTPNVVEGILENNYDFIRKVGRLNYVV